MTYVSLGLSNVAIAASLIFINALISFGFKLNLERTLAVAAIRMVVQLAAVGFVLRLIFEATSPWVTLAAGLFMAGVAGIEAGSRLERPFEGWRAYGLGATTLLVTGLLAAIFTSTVIIGPDPWYQPRVIIPILGMVLGNALTGVSLVLDTLSDVASRERVAIEARLALGATRFTAFDVVLKRALRTGMIPILNTMAAAGVVSLPGMMTGQILAGVAPMEAAKYQMMILFVIAGSTALAVIATALGGLLLLTDDRHRLRLDRLKPSTA
jgi:putative ABC transport system permease protein